MYRLIMAVALLLALGGAWGQSPPPNHQHPASPPNLIDGAKHPELVSDAAAYRLYLITLSLPPNFNEQDRAAQQAHLSKIDLAANDLQAMTTVLAEFRSQYDAWISRYNAAATTQGNTFDPTPFLQQQEDIVQSTREMLKRTLSPKGMSKLHAHIQDEKKRMKVAGN